MSFNKVLVLGSSGLLGTYLSKHLASHGFCVLRHSRSSQVTDPELTFELNPVDTLVHIFAKYKPCAVVNLIALANVDSCERNPELAIACNLVSSAVLAESISRANTAIKCIHVSTDQVFSSSIINPLNTYSRTKLWSESIFTGYDSIVIRANFLCKSLLPDRTSLTDWIISCLRESKNFSAFRDIYFNPVHVSQLCELIRISILNPQLTGLVHASSFPPISKADVAFALAEQLSLSPSIINLTDSSSGTSNVIRPKNMSMPRNNDIVQEVWPHPSSEEVLSLLAKDYL